MCACVSWPPLSLLSSCPSISPQNPFTIRGVHCKLNLQFGKYERNAIVYSDIVRNLFFQFFFPQSCNLVHTNLMRIMPCAFSFSLGRQRATKPRQINQQDLLRARNEANCLCLVSVCLFLLTLIVGEKKNVHESSAEL